MEDTDDQQRAIIRHAECSKDVRRVGIVLLVYSLFCFLTLGQPDEMTVKSGGDVQIPFANVRVDFFRFLIIGPLLLILIAGYLHLFIHEMKKYNFIAQKFRLPYAFNMNSRLAEWLSNSTFYLVVPVLLFMFAIKVRAWPEVWIWVLLAFVATTLLFLRYHNLDRLKNWTRSQYSFIIVFTGLCGVLAYPGTISSLFPLQLAAANLEGENLTRFSLRGVNAEFAILSDADLHGKNLDGANFSGAKLKGTNFQGAKLRFALLENAHLQGANLSGADLQEADLSLADAEQANFNFANLQGALLYRASLRGVTFTGAKLQGANFSSADMAGVSLNLANLAGARLDGADLRGADLMNVDNLTQEQLALACGDDATLLPPKLSIEPCAPPAPDDDS